MKYKNINTGVVIETTSKLIGKSWKALDGIEQKTSTEEYIEEEVDLEKMTKAELVALAKEHEIEVNERDTKAVLIETIANAFE